MGLVNGQDVVPVSFSYYPVGVGGSKSIGVNHSLKRSKTRKLILLLNRGGERRNFQQFLIDRY